MRELSVEEMRQGVCRLRQLLPAARASLKEIGALRDLSCLTTAQAPYVVEGNFAALTVTPGEQGGWSADLLLRNVPTGVADIIGSPTESPFPTREAAEAGCMSVLLLALAVEREVATGRLTPEEPAFLFHGLRVELSANVLAKLATHYPDGAPDYATYEWTLDRIERAKAELLPDGVTLESLRALSKGATLELRTVLHMAAFVGMIAYPPHKPRPPAPPEDAAQVPS